MLVCTPVLLVCHSKEIISRNSRVSPIDADQPRPFNPFNVGVSHDQASKTDNHMTHGVPRSCPLWHVCPDPDKDASLPRRAAHRDAPNDVAHRAPDPRACRATHARWNPSRPPAALPPAPSARLRLRTRRFLFNFPQAEAHRDVPSLRDRTRAFPRPRRARAASHPPPRTPPRCPLASPPSRLRVRVRLLRRVILLRSLLGPGAGGCPRRGPPPPPRRHRHEATRECPRARERSSGEQSRHRPRRGGARRPDARGRDGVSILGMASRLGRSGRGSTQGAVARGGGGRGDEGEDVGAAAGGAGGEGGVKIKKKGPRWMKSNPRRTALGRKRGWRSPRKRLSTEAAFGDRARPRCRVWIAPSDRK